MYVALRDGTRVLASSLEELRSDLIDVLPKEVEHVSLELGARDVDVSFKRSNAFLGTVTILNVSGMDETKVFGLHAKIRKMITRRFREFPRFRFSTWQRSWAKGALTLFIAPLLVAVTAGVVLYLLHVV